MLHFRRSNSFDEVTKVFSFHRTLWHFWSFKYIFRKGNCLKLTLCQCVYVRNQPWGISVWVFLLLWCIFRLQIRIAFPLLTWKCENINGQDWEFTVLSLRKKDMATLDDMWGVRSLWRPYIKSIWHQLSVVLFLISTVPASGRKRNGLSSWNYGLHGERHKWVWNYPSFLQVNLSDFHSFLACFPAVIFPFLKMKRDIKSEEF